MLTTTLSTGFLATVFPLSCPTEAADNHVAGIPGFEQRIVCDDRLFSVLPQVVNSTTWDDRRFISVIQRIEQDHLDRCVLIEPAGGELLDLRAHGDPVFLLGDCENTILAPDYGSLVIIGNVAQHGEVVHGRWCDVLVLGSFDGRATFSGRSYLQVTESLTGSLSLGSATDVGVHVHGDWHGDLRTPQVGKHGQRLSIAVDGCLDEEKAQEILASPFLMVRCSVGCARKTRLTRVEMPVSTSIERTLSLSSVCQVANPADREQRWMNVMTSVAAIRTSGVATIFGPSVRHWTGHSVRHEQIDGHCQRPVNIQGTMTTPAVIHIKGDLLDTVTCSGVCDVVVSGDIGASGQVVCERGLMSLFVGGAMKGSVIGGDHLFGYVGGDVLGRIAAARRETRLRVGGTLLGEFQMIGDVRLDLSSVPQDNLSSRISVHEHSDAIVTAQIPAVQGIFDSAAGDLVLIAVPH